MKKFLLIILILALCASPLLFAACSNVSQSSLLSFSYVCSEDGYELFTYDVFKDNAVVGAMTMKFEPLYDRSVTMVCLTEASGEKTFSGVTGTLLSVDLAMNNGDTIKSRVLYDGNFAPIFSYKKTVISTDVKEMQVSYEGKYLYTKLYVNGEEGPSTEHKASGCFDNEMLYALVRASAIGSSSYSFSFTSVNPLTAAPDTITISRASQVNESVKALEPTVLPEGTETYTVPCYQFRISIDNAYAGSYTMNVAKENQTVKNDTLDINKVKKIIVSITEGDYLYKLSDVEIV